MQLQSTRQIRDLPVPDRLHHAIILVFRTNGTKVRSKASAAFRISAHTICRAGMGVWAKSRRDGITGKRHNASNEGEYHDNAKG